MVSAEKPEPALKKITSDLFEVTWRPDGESTYDPGRFAGEFAASDLGRWLEARRDCYALLTEPDGRYAYLRIGEESVCKLLALKLSVPL